jgi:putative FmdB family regulatory protein
VPLYDYTCLECDRQVQKVAKFDDRSTKECEACGKAMVREFPTPFIGLSKEQRTASLKKRATDHAKKPSSVEEAAHQLRKQGVR